MVNAMIVCIFPYLSEFMIYIYYQLVAVCSASYTDRYNQSAPGKTMQKVPTENSTMNTSLTCVSFISLEPNSFRKAWVAMLGIM